ncbi:MAG: hypothetical protein ACHQAR_06725 [Steroidobacterales bacterium]
MFTRTLNGTAALCTGALLLSACGDGSSGSSGSMPVVQTQVAPVDTQQLLAMARVTSESSDAALVGKGALMVADDSDETSDPLPVG